MNAAAMKILAKSPSRKVLFTRVFVDRAVASSFFPFQNNRGLTCLVRVVSYSQPQH